MKYFLLILFGLVSLSPSAQIPSDSIYTTKKVYAQIMGINKNVLGIGNKISIDIDFGEEKFFWGNDGRNLLVDENGKDLKFNSMVDAMNFMGKLGWHYEDSYVITIAGHNVIHFLLSKEMPIEAEARDGIVQKRDMRKKKEKKAVDDFDPIY